MWVTLQKGNSKKRIKEGIALWFILLGPFYTLFKGDLKGTLWLFIINAVVDLALPGLGLLLMVVFHMLLSTYWSKSYIVRLRRDGWK